MSRETVRIVSKNQLLRTVFRDFFASKDFEVSAQARPGRKKRCTLGVWCFDGDIQLPRRSLKDHLNCEFPMLFKWGKFSGEFHSAAFDKGAYVCHSFGRTLSYERSVPVVFQKSKDLLTMAELMGEWPHGSKKPQWLDAFAESTETGLSVIDRNFRIWYRNEAHKMIAGSRSSCPICWVAYHGLRHLLDACPDCPSNKMFRANEGPVGPVRMVIGFESSDKRLARPTEVTAVPLRGSDQGIIGSIEMVKDIMGRLEEEDIGKVGDWLEAILTRVFLTDFKRARLYLLTPSSTCLTGFVAVAKAGPKLTITSIRIPVGEKLETLPDKPLVRDMAAYGEDEVLYEVELDKKNAPYWADLPFYDEKRKVVGKIVVDRWSNKDPDSRLIQSGDIVGYDKALSLIGRVVTRARSLMTSREIVEAANTVRFMVEKADKLSCLEAYYDLLFQAVRRVSGVLSALIRKPVVDEKGRKVLRCVKGYGVYTEHSVVDLDIKDSEIAGELYRKQKNAVVVMTTASSLQLKEGNINRVTDEKHRNELSRIKYQGSFRISPAEEQEPLLFSVQAETSAGFDSGSLALIADTFALLLDSFFVRRYSDELKKSFLALLKLHDVDTAEHSERVAKIAQIIAEDDKMRGISAEHAYLAGCIHDIGKIGLARGILRGHTRLAPAEQWYVKAHVELVTDVLGDITHMRNVVQAAREHHMWYNGEGGYPLPGNSTSTGGEKQTISLLGGILAVADCFETMTSPLRYYRKPLSFDAAMKEIQRGAGKQFHPDVVEAFVRQFGKITVALGQT